MPVAPGAVDPITGQPIGSDPGSTGVPIAGSGGGTGAVPTIPSGVTPIPCDVGTAVKANCQGCHGATPIGGAPMSLITYEDFQADHVVQAISGGSTAALKGQTMKVYELAKLRINEMERPMPPSGTMDAAAHTMLDGWLAGGAVAGTEADRTCATDPGTTDPGTIQPSPTTGPNGSRCDAMVAYEALVARPGETCYEFPTHGASAPGDTSKFTIHTGESYNQYYFDVPWPAGTVATRFGADFDNLPVLHHWLAFETSESTAAGTVSPDVTGTTLGTNATLIGGWAIGGCNVEFPDDMGLQLPGPGRKIMIQWHDFNNTGMPQQDGSKVQFCTVPAGMRPNTGGLTWLGTENFNGILGMPPGMNNFHGTCINDSTGPITIVAFWPHMHTIGINMKSVVTRKAGGTPEVVFDKPFKFDYQIHYTADPPVVLQPGDSIQSTCTFMNTTGHSVAFGQSTTSEMCYQFAFSYPAGALDNGVASLIGATNTCWQFGE